jgi:hypothetical protein
MKKAEYSDIGNERSEVFIFKEFRFMKKNYTSIEKIARAAAKATYISILKFAQTDSKLDTVMGLLNLTTADCSAMENGNKCIITFTQYGMNRVPDVKKSLNVPATQRTIAGLYAGGIFFYDPSDNVIKMN